jgi:catechol 2,3-dioxygenase-like lactoylglutathione lyase family enzyme
VDCIVGLEGVRTQFAMLQTPDGNGRLELVKFHSPSNQGDNRHAPANAPGIRHIAFAVEDTDAVVAGLRACGAELVGELERYKDSYRLCYVRGPGGNHHRASGADRLTRRVRCRLSEVASRGSDSPAGRTRRALTCLTDPDHPLASIGSGPTELRLARRCRRLPDQAVVAAGGETSRALCALAPG